MRFCKLSICPTIPFAKATDLFSSIIHAALIAVSVYDFYLRRVPEDEHGARHGEEVVLDALPQL